MITITRALGIAFFCLSPLALAQNDPPVHITFDKVKPNRKLFSEKIVHIDGRVKDLKIFKEGSNKFATFFLTDPSNPENSIAVKVSLMKKKTVLNTFSCTDGEYTTVVGRFKPWGVASFLGNLEVHDAYAFKCSDTVPTPSAPAKVKTSEPKVADVKISDLKISDDLKPTLSKTGGAGTITILDPKGKAIKDLGAVIEPGSTITTGDHTAVQLKYPDGSKVALAANSKLVTQAGTKDVQSIDLEFGRVHALIAKSKAGQVHFKVKTRSATMGVRGTQFLVESSPNGITTTRVVTGQVDVARSEAELFTAEAKPVYRDELLSVENGVLGQIQNFDSGRYLAQLRAEQPELLALNEDNVKNSDLKTSDVKTPEPQPAVAVASPAPPAPETHTDESVRWTAFRIAALNYSSPSNGSAMLSWTPETHWSGGFNLGLDLGYGTLNSTLEYALVGAIHFAPEMALEIKGGALTAFSPSSSTAVMGGGALRYEWNANTFFNRLILGVDFLSVSGVTSNVLRAAIGFHL